MEGLTRLRLMDTSFIQMDAEVMTTAGVWDPKHHGIVPRSLHDEDGCGVVGVRTMSYYSSI